ncbi:MAG: DUF5916 domain-containing protein [Saprospiraceae bacterium]
MKCCPLFIFITAFLPSFSQNEPAQTQQSFIYNGITTTEKITIDGLLNEGIWEKVEKACTFQEHWPQNGREVIFKTEAMVTHDDQFLYVGFVCHDIDQHYIVQTLKRDYEFDGSDAMSIMVDPAGQQNTAYFFSITPKGVQADAILNRFDFDANWDTKWYSSVKTYDDKWVAELAIPLHIMRYDPNQMTWGLNFIRGDVKNYRFYTWTKIPQQYDGIDLGYFGKLAWDGRLPNKKGKVTLIPYTNLSDAKDFEENENTARKIGFGADTKITLSSSLNLDLTLNPDFSQVEVDQQVTNLTRFDVYFPERRNFFLENADLFSQFGDPESPIFFSRRIGLDDEGRSVPILGGARLTGNVGDSWRLGMLSMQTKETAGQAGQNYSAFTLHKKLFKRSLVKGLLTNRQGMAGKEFSNIDYGRNASLEAIYQNGEGSVLSWIGLHRSFKNTIEAKRAMYSTGFFIRKKNIAGLLSLSTVGTNYTSDMGFVNQLDLYDALRDTVIRQGFHSASNMLSYTLRTPNHKIVSSHEFRINNNLKINPDDLLTEWNLKAGYNLYFASSSLSGITLVHNFTRLLFPFSFTEDTPLVPGKYTYTNLKLEYSSDLRKKFVVKFEGTVGGFYNGDIQSTLFGVKYRAQPWGNFEMNVEYSDLKFPEPFGRARFLLINPRIEFNFSKNLFWTTFLQYNTQADNFNVNSRLQWRYRPMSDIYLVYTDNHAVEFWGPKNRSMVLKINYWF